MRPSRPLFAALLLLAASACGGSAASTGDSIDAGYSSLNSGQAADALSSFDSALDGLTVTDGRYLEAKMGQLRAQCYVDAAKAKSGLLALSKDLGVEAKHYNLVVTDMVAAASKLAGTNAEAASTAIDDAVAILVSGKQTFPEYPKWDGLVKKVGDKAKAFGSADSLAALKGLGYVGGD